MADIRIYPRATEPHGPTLASALIGILTLRGIWYDKGSVSIVADYGSVTDTAVQALVDAAPVASPLLDAKLAADRISLVERAAYLTLLDLINVERARHAAPAVTKAAFIQAVRDRVDTA